MPLNDTLAMSDLDLCYLPATEQIALFKSGELSPVDVLKAQFARAEAVEPVINAFTDIYCEAAMDAARAAEEVYMNRPGDARPLEGVTVAIKDEMDVKGQRNTQGSLIYKDHIADETHPVAQRLRDAGAIFHARSATPEFCSAWTTETRLHGVTRNPWNPEYTPRDRQAAPVRRWLRALPRWRPDRILAAQSGARRRCAGLSVLNRPTEGCRMQPPSIWIPIAMSVPWHVRSMTAQ
ncbi:hypothetical protein ETW23_03200 [Leisingera sp. NJS201]|nr:hypothetical protein ETW23_03200 [Leisingera sp. NJS201]